LNTFITNGSTMDWLNKTNIKSMTIKLPKNKQVIEDMNLAFKKLETVKEDIKKADESYKQLIKELGQEAIENHEILD